MEKKWIFKEDPDGSLVDELSKSINVNPYLSKLLVQRGISSFEEAKNYFRPSLDDLENPFEMKNMDKAVNRLSEAIYNKDKILLYGDYDVDGTTAVSLLYLFLKQFTDNIEFYIPDRYTEGYGISKQGLEWAVKNKVGLFISLDCGITAIDQAKYAAESNIDLIICDHHLPKEELPNAFAILDPKQLDCPYPFKELSGCGVGFKLLEAFCQQNSIDKSKLFESLDLLAVSISSDLVSMTGENRILTYYGLKKLNKSPIPGLKSLIEISGQKKDLTVSDVVFTIGPRINATGRLTHAKESVNLLIGKNSDSTTAFAENLNARNIERRGYDQTITKEAIEMIESQQKDRKSTVLFKEDWHKGVIGIVASRCIEHYYRPTIILTKSDDMATGSARSVDGFNVHEAISECADLLEKFGGHKYAAGLTLPIENIDTFIDKFEEVVSKRILPEQLQPKIIIDTELPLEQISFKMLSILSQMEPFGPENLSPIFSSKNVSLKSELQIIKEEHIKGFVKTEDNSKCYEFIGFGLAQKAEKLKPGIPFEIAYHLEENIYMQNKSIILNVKDLRIDG